MLYFSVCIYLFSIHMRLDCAVRIFELHFKTNTLLFKDEKTELADVLCQSLECKTSAPTTTEFKWINGIRLLQVIHMLNRKYEIKMQTVYERFIFMQLIFFVSDKKLFEEMCCNSFVKLKNYFVKK